MRLFRIVEFSGLLGLLGCVACGTSAEDLNHVWNDLTAMRLMALPTLQDFAQQSRWVPPVDCAGGGVLVNSNRVEAKRQQALGATVRAEQDGIHDIALRDCRPSTLTYSGDLQRELQLVRSSDPGASRTVDWLHGSVHLRGDWEDTCFVNLRGTERGGQIVYRGRLCDEQVEHTLPVP